MTREVRRAYLSASRVCTLFAAVTVIHDGSRFVGSGAEPAAVGIGDFRKRKLLTLSESS